MGGVGEIDGQYRVKNKGGGRRRKRKKREETKIKNKR